MWICFEFLDRIIIFKHKSNLVQLNVLLGNVAVGHYMLIFVRKKTSLFGLKNIYFFLLLILTLKVLIDIETSLPSAVQGSHHHLACS